MPNISDQLEVIRQYITAEDFSYAQEELKRLCLSDLLSQSSEDNINVVITLTHDLSRWLLQQGEVHYEEADKINELITEALLKTNISDEILARFYYITGDDYLERDLLELALFKYHQALDKVEHNDGVISEYYSFSEISDRINRLEIIGRYREVKKLMDQHVFKDKKLDEFSWEPIRQIGDALLSLNDTRRLGELYKELLANFYKFLEIRLHHIHQAVFDKENECAKQEKYSNSFKELLRLYSIIQGLLPTLREHQQYSRARELYSLFEKSAVKYKNQGVSDVSQTLEDIAAIILQLNKYIINSPHKNNTSEYQPIWQDARKRLHALREKLHKDIQKQGCDILSIQECFTAEVRTHLGDLIKQCSVFLGEPPCAFALMGVGSISYGLYPYSDLDCALFIAQERHRQHPYFTSLIQFFNFQLNLLGEFQLNIFGRVRTIRSGLHMDSGDLNMFLIGDLIHTPEEFVKKHHPVNTDSLDAAQPELYAMLTPVLIYSSEYGKDLLLHYKRCLDEKMQWLKCDEKNDKNPPYHQQLAILYREAHCFQYKKEEEIWRQNERAIINIKSRYIAPMIFFIKDLALFLGVCVNNISQILEVFNILDIDFLNLKKPYTMLVLQRFQLHLGAKAQSNICDETYFSTCMISLMSSVPFTTLFERVLSSLYGQNTQRLIQIRNKEFDEYGIPLFFSYSKSYPVKQNIEKLHSKLINILRALIKEDNDEAITRILYAFSCLKLHCYQGLDNITLLHDAAFHGVIKATKLLLKRGAKIDIAGGEYREKPIHQAAKKGWVSIVKLFLEHPVNMDVNAKAGGKWTLLHKAVRPGQVKMVQYLLSEEADVHATCFPRQGTRNGKGWTALHLAAFFNRVEIIPELIKAGADLETRCDLVSKVKKITIDDCTPLHLAVYHAGHEPKPELSIIRTLVDFGANKNAKTKAGETALHLAVRFESEEIVKTLLELNVDTEEQNAKGETPVCYTTSNRNEAMIKLLMGYGANIRARKKNGTFAIGCPGMHHLPIDNCNSISKYAEEQFGLQAASSVRKTRELEQTVKELQQKNEKLEEKMGVLEETVKHLQDMVQQLMDNANRNTNTTQCRSSLFTNKTKKEKQTTTSNNDSEDFIHPNVPK